MKQTMTKSNILIFIDWFLPAYKAGGQIPSVANIVKTFEEHVNFYIVTSDRDSGDTVPFANIELNKWLNFGKGKIIYLSPEKQNAGEFQKIFQSQTFHKIYFNSFFSYKFTLLPLKILKKQNFSGEIVLAPRGMLAKKALQIKGFKKKFFIILSKITKFYSRITWHASSENEKQEIEAVFGKNNIIKIACDISNISSETKFQKKKKEKGSLNLFFISRITEKKNLLGALKILQKVKNSSINFTIWGPIENLKYWKQCEEIITKLPDNITVTYCGILKNSEIGVELQKQHVFLFPTFNENFGHVIAEALINGCPAIISNNTPWNDLEKNNSGFAFSLNEEQKFAEAIEYYANMNEAEFTEISKKTYNYACEKLSSQKIIEDNRAVFLS